MDKNIFKFGLGDSLKDEVTGFNGIVMGRTEYMTGCKHYGLAGRKISKGEKLPDWEWFDEIRLKKSGIGIKFKKAKEDDGGPFPNAPGIN